MRQLSGSLLALVFALCSIGYEPLVETLTALGLGAMMNDTVLLPLSVISLGLALWGFYAARKLHQQTKPLYAAAAASLIGLAGLWISPAVALTGFIFFVLTAVWDLSVLQEHNLKKSI